jgi:hypothetical protein
MNKNPLIEKLEAMPADHLLSPKELVAVGIGQSETRLYHMRLRGDGLPYIKIPRRTYLYSSLDVIEWLKTCQHLTMSTKAVAE